MGSQASSPARADAVRVMESLRRLVRFLRVTARRAEQDTGVSAAQLFVVQQLAQAPARSLAELAGRTLTDASSVSTVVSRLVEQGLVVRRRAADDRRRVELALTARGRALAARTPELAQARVVRAVRGLPAAERRALVASLGHLVASVGADAGPARMLFDDEPRGRRRGR